MKSVCELSIALSFRQSERTSFCKMYRSSQAAQREVPRCRKEKKSEFMGSLLFFYIRRTSRIHFIRLWNVCMGILDSTLAVTEPLVAGEPTSKHPSTTHASSIFLPALASTTRNFRNHVITNILFHPFRLYLPIFDSFRRLLLFPLFLFFPFLRFSRMDTVLSLYNL